MADGEMRGFSINLELQRGSLEKTKIEIWKTSIPFYFCLNIFGKICLCLEICVL